ncbi:MAG: VOC family protein [Flavobacteriales bacterium]|nr:VOC family protein [Flavobacteriales bacterium]
MNPNNNIFTWVEIHVTDFYRAKNFYESLLGLPIHESKIGEVLHGFWGHTENSVGGAIVREGTPSKTGTIVYFDGGEVLLDKTLIAKEIGYQGIFLDTEGNRLAFWSSK